MSLVADNDMQELSDASVAYRERLRLLSEASVERSFIAFRDVPWDDPAFQIADDDERWVLPKSDMLGAHPWYQALSRERQLEVAPHPTTAMTKTGAQFEQLLLMGGTQFLLRQPNQNPEFRYFLHELTEETHHIQMFQEFTNRTCPEVSGCPRWLVHLFPFVAHIGTFYPGLFFAIILAGEEPIDHYQKMILRTSQIPPLLQRIMAIHAAEEARHIGFAHAWLAEHTPRMSWLSRAAIAVLTPIVMRIGADAIIVPSVRDRRLMGLPRKVVRDVWFRGPQARHDRALLFGDVRMLFDQLGMRTRATRWIWRLMGVDGRPSRYRSEPRY
jgi:hypothetical protein